MATVAVDGLELVVRLSPLEIVTVGDPQASARAIRAATGRT
jgi:hypothetical protein